MPAARRARPYGAADAGAHAHNGDVAPWWSREHWRSELVTALATDTATTARHGSARGSVSVAACAAVGRALSNAADGATGRNAMPGNGALTRKDDDLAGDVAAMAVATGYAQSTVQRAVTVLTQLGFLRIVTTGKNRLTRTERIALWRTGSKARVRRNVFDCTLPRGAHPTQAAEPAREPEPVDNPPGPPADSDPGGDLPTAIAVVDSSLVDDNKIFTPEPPSRSGPTGRHPTREAPPTRTYRSDRRTEVLARDVRTCIPWLRDCSPRRIQPALHRFAVCGWTAPELQDALDRLLVVRDWRLPDRHPTPVPGRRRPPALRCPWGYLAMLLRGLEPTDRPAEIAARRAAESRRWELWRASLLDPHAPRCRHGQPRGHQANPGGVIGCPLCRAAR